MPRVGRPNNQYSPEIIAKIEQYALNNSKAETIARGLNIPVNTLKRNFGRLMRQKRAEGKLLLKANQIELAKKYPAMAIFLGKNDLGQTDKQDIHTTQSFVEPALTDIEREALADITRSYKVKLATKQKSA